MTDNSRGLHEDPQELAGETVEAHRALVSVMEELEAVDWYSQRASATADPELRAILEHNRDEEKEHAAMVLEWLRRNDATLDRYLRTYLFQEGSIVDIEAQETDAGDAPASESLGLGSLKGRA